MPYELLFLKALALTVSTEMLMGGVVKRLFPRYFGIHVKGWRFFLYIAVASCLTLPYVWFLWRFFIQDRIIYLIVSELWVAIVEGFYYVFSLKMPWYKALVFSFLLNGFSFGVGLLIKI